MWMVCSPPIDVALVMPNSHNSLLVVSCDTEIEFAYKRFEYLSGSPPGTTAIVCVSSFSPYESRRARVRLPSSQPAQSQT